MHAACPGAHNSVADLSDAQYWPVALALCRESQWDARVHTQVNKDSCTLQHEQSIGLCA